MLLQENPSAQSHRRTGSGADDQAMTTSGRLRGTPPRPTAFAPGRAYPPITWTSPSLGRSVADGLGGISKAMVAAVLTVGALVAAGIVAALLITTVVQAFGIDLASRY
ncbi:hypothetical protein [Actinoplanes siamensis]|uniref:Uncharacterized protein n=1 Tax=Actinoplanes siamensis TaxID=1223317 RepID=A0A919N8S1_9ACTN|nr:hypothetical protein [Actinoplanes siamensis]GIF06583.1 hypothetical protein Asi03nite_41210 [Actinoplanes siamensis]